MLCFVFQIILPHFLQAIKPHIEKFWSDDMANAWRALFALIIYYMEDGIGRAGVDKRKLSQTFSVT